MTKGDAIYARYSSHKQDDSTSIEVQIEACERAAGHPCAHYIDRARTGRAVAGRGELQRLLADAEAGKIHRLWLYKYDRLGRAAATHAIVEDLEDLGVEVISVSEGTNALARGVNLVVAQDFSRQLGQRTRDGLMKRHQQRSWTGGTPPYGFAIASAAEGRRQIVIDAEESETVRWLFATYLAESVGVKELAKRLAARGAKTRRGARWSFTTVRAMLTNRMFMGEVRYGARQMKLNRKTGRRVPRFRPTAEHQVYVDTALAIIPKEDFERVQTKLAERSTPRSGHRVAGGIRPFTGFLFCGSCGSVCYSRISRNKKGEYFYFACGCRQRNRDTCSNAASVREDLLLAEVLAAYQSIFDDADLIVDAATRKAERILSAQNGRLEEVQSELSRLDREIDRLHGLLLDAADEPAARRSLLRKIGEMETDRETLQKTTAGLASQSSLNASRLTAAVRQAFGDARDRLTNVASPAQLHRFIEDFVGPMVVKPDGSIVPKLETTQPSEESEGCVIGNIAGGGFEPPTSGL
jgi:DNA invertase Pin-like site-specific DNA recombinase